MSIPDSSSFERLLHRKSRGGGPQSGRVGIVNGKPSRTFHCRYGSIRRHQGGMRRVLSGAEYINREGHFSSRDDLHTSGGDMEGLIADIEEIDRTARRKDERVAITLVHELPADAPETWLQVALDVQDEWKRRGHSCIYAIHSKGTDGNAQPHVHYLISARPRGTDGKIDRDPARRPLKDRQAVKAERRIIADIINACNPSVSFHPGRLAETGINRPAKARVSIGEYRRKAGRSGRARTVNEMIEGGDPAEFETIKESRAKWSAQKKHAAFRRRLEKKLKKGAKLEKQGFVPVARLQTVAKQYEAKLAEVRSQAIRPLNVKQMDYLADVHRKLGIELPDVFTEVGQAEAFAAVRAYEASRKAEKADRPPTGREAPSAPPAGKKAALPDISFDPADNDGNKAKVSKLQNEELMALFQDRQEKAGLPGMGGAMAKLDFRVLRTEAMRRGLIAKPQSLPKPKILGISLGGD